MESGRAMSLAGSTPAPSAVVMRPRWPWPYRWCPWCNGSTRDCGSRRRRVQPPPGTLSLDDCGGRRCRRTCWSDRRCPEPELATDPRDDRGPGAGDALERRRPGRRARRVPALHLGRVGPARARPDGARASDRPRSQAAGARGRLPDAVRPAPLDGRHLQPAERRQARPPRPASTAAPSRAGRRSRSTTSSPALEAARRAGPTASPPASTCNARKADRTPEQAGMRLRRRPARPDWKPLYAARAARVESWARFLDEEPALALA